MLLVNYNFDVHERDDDGLAVLHSAALGGDLELFQYLIQNGSDVYSKTKNGRSCLHIAAEEGHLRICRVLLENYNFDVQQRDDDGLAVLHNAALGGDLELFQYLIQNGSDVYSKTKDGRSSLHLAAEKGHLKICRVLLQNYNFDIHERDDDMFTVMLRAACSDDLELLEYLIQNGSNIFSKTKDGRSCLHIAAEKGHLKICRVLLQNYNFDIHERDDSGWSALHHGAWSFDLELFQYLIEKGSDIFVKTRKSRSCLHLAALVGDLRICRVVLRNYNVDINARDDYGFTVLHSAAGSGHSELLQYLIENGSDVFRKTKNGKSCLHLAAERGHLKICRVLLQHYNFVVDERDDDGSAVLHSAALGGNLELFQYLIENGSDVFSKTKNGRSCLHIAAEQGHLKICRMLLTNYNFAFHERDDDGLAVLHNAALSGDLELFQDLIENGSDVFSKTKNGRSCFHIAAEEGYLKICRVLLENYNFDVHERDDDGLAVLHSAALGGDLELFQYLIQNGSDVYSKTKNGRSCLHIAAEEGHLRICRVLLENYNFDVHERDDDGLAVLHNAALGGDLELFQYLIQNGSDVYSKTKDGRSSLHLAAEKGHLKICRVLLQNYNFDIHERDDSGWSALHHGAWSFDLELFQYLIEKGSDIFVKTRKNRSCLHLAALVGDLRICRVVLRNYNVDINARDDYGFTVLHSAAGSGDSELLQYLIENGSEVFSKTENGRNCLHVAAEKGHLKICRMLLQSYNFVNHERDDDGLTVLHSAVLSGELELLQYLIENGSDVFSKTKDGRSCLHLAAEQGDLNICRMLLQNYNFVIQEADDDGFTVLHSAALGGDLALLQYLIKNGSEVFSKTKDGRNCLHLAAEKGHLNICRALLENYNFDIHARDDDMFTVLLRATFSDNLELLEYLIDHGSDVFSKTTDGRSCLHLAAQNGHLEICKALLQKYNFDIDATDDSSWTLLHGAAWSGDSELLLYLIENGSDIFIETKDGRSCLHLTAEQGHLNICRMLLQSYNFVNHERDDDGLTVLHSAVLSGELELLQYLIENGSDVFSKTKDGRSCLHLAAEQGDLNICRMLLQNYNFVIHEADDDGFTVLHSAALGGDLALLQYFIKNGSEVFSKTKDGRNCLHLAAEKGHLNICRALLENYNFDIHARDDYMFTVLLRAACSDDLKLLEYLIENGSDLFSKTKDGRSCLHLAAQNGHLEICEALLQKYNIDIHATDDSSWTALHGAAWSGDLELLEYLIENGSDIFSETKDGRSCLHLAAERGHFKICKALLQKYNIDIHATDDSSWTALHGAAWSGDLELLQDLIENGSDVFRETKDGRCCLHLAAERGHLKICRALLQNYNFDVYARDFSGLSVLHHAAWGGDLELFEYLVENGSDIFSKIKDGGTCLHLAAQNGQFKICKALLQKYNFDIHATDDSSRTALHGAAWSGDLELLQYLIENGSDIFSETKDGRSCLHIAAERGHLKICRALLQNYNFDIYARDDSGLYVSHHAAWSGDLELFQYLIEKGSDIFIKTKNNSSCLHFAAKVGGLKICRAVLQNYNFDINARDDDGFTVLHSAAWSGDSELWQYLIENGSDIFSKTKNGRSCLHIAAEQGHLKICRVLLENYNFVVHGRDDDGLAVLHSAALGGDLELFQYLIENGGDVFSKTKDGRSCLHLAAEKGHLNICRALLENYNFDIHARDDDMFTVLLRATCSEDLELMEYLIENGSNIFSKTKDGRSCLHIAAEKGHLRICRALLQNYNFGIHERDDAGFTLLHHAAWSFDLDLFQYLIEKGSNVFSKTKDDRNCLHLAAERGDLKICKVVFQNYNFDIHARDDDERTVFHYAALSGDLELLLYLIENGSHIFSKTKNGNTCLHLAAEKGRLKICRELLQKYNFDIHAIDDYGCTVLHCAAKSGDLELFQYLLASGSDIFSKTKDGKSALHLAANNGHLKICVALLQSYNFDIHPKDDDGWNVLHCAARSGNLELFKYLIAKGSEVDSKTKDHANCLHIAAWNGRFNICKELLEKYSFNIHEKNEKGFDAILCAAEFGDLEMYQYFKENGNYVSSKTKDSRHLLHIAASKGRFNLIKSILKYYLLEIEIKCNKGWTVLHYSAQSGNLELFEYLLKNGSLIDEKTKNKCNCLHIAASNGHLNLCKRLLDNYSFDIFMTDAKGWNALHYAAKSGNLELFHFFIKKGSDVYSKTKINSNCLHITASNGCLKLFKTLVEAYKFDIFTKDDRGWTVLNKAAKGGDLKLFQYLIRLGADIYSRTNDNVTCLHIASYHGHLKLCQTMFHLYYLDLEKWTCNEFENIDKWNATYRQRLFKTKSAFLNLRDLGGFTYLHYASSQGHADICKFLLMHNVDVTYRNRQGKTARDIAINKKQPKVLDVLKDKYDPFGK